MTEDWRKNIYRMILDYSDLEMQKRIWLGKDSKFESSYDEDISLLFDSFEFEDFIKEWKIEKQNHELLGELIVFRNKLSLYNDKVLSISDRSDEDILNDPDWLVIVNQAKVVIEKWEALNMN